MELVRNLIGILGSQERCQRYDTMASKDEEEPLPSWVEDQPDATPKNEDDNDETTPLFGTGPVSLEDNETDEEKATAPALSYGSVPKKEEAADEKDEEEETSSWHDEPQVEALDKNGKKIKPDKKKKAKATTETGPSPPRKNFLLWFFSLVQMIAVLSGVGMVLVQVLPLFYVPLKTIGVLKLALRLYVSMFCVIIILVECEAPIPLLRNSHLLQNYFTRGVMYSFVGLVGTEEAYEMIVSNMVESGDGFIYNEFHIEWAPLFIKCSSWPMLITGWIYMIMGVLCMRPLRDRMNRNYKEAMEQYKQEQSAATAAAAETSKKAKRK